MAAKKRVEKYTKEIDEIGAETSVLGKNLLIFLSLIHHEQLRLMFLAAYNKPVEIRTKLAPIAKIGYKTKMIFTPSGIKIETSDEAGLNRVCVELDATQFKLYTCCETFAVKVSTPKLIESVNASGEHCCLKWEVTVDKNFNLVLRRELVADYNLCALVSCHVAPLTLVKMEDKLPSYGKQTGEFKLDSNCFQLPSSVAFPLKIAVDSGNQKLRFSNSESLGNALDGTFNPARPVKSVTITAKDGKAIKDASFSLNQKWTESLSAAAKNSEEGTVTVDEKIHISFTKTTTKIADFVLEMD
ncbi:Oidioi.mRNA.OKI2018_I69.chr1.g3558.t1.cds [Oikopleura dioica]|uniref:Oidioi.mRNA.OKI2018_I69.chr1.g3558.t1.cds n=1 Tax=Oikopleura dioica TaxID=34765 RepID=A0ABN7T002_OIKDI|nr:Oidioi.mRNA.OKI2018_I69.chr1.g3558.t1.cds [Oikopleura dioica]